jgi:hypothetical protein
MIEESLVSGVAVSGDAVSGFAEPAIKAGEKRGPVSVTESPTEIGPGDETLGG